MVAKKIVKAGQLAVGDVLVEDMGEFIANRLVITWRSAPEHGMVGVAGNGWTRAFDYDRSVCVEDQTVVEDEEAWTDVEESDADPDFPLDQF